MNYPPAKAGGFSATTEIKRSTLKMIKKHWSEINDDQKNKILQKTPKQKMYYWGHLRRYNKELGYKKCREIMSVKYSGENH